MLTQFERIFTLDYEHTRKGGSYHIELKDGILYITFQYSKGFKDWLYNFTFPKKAYKRMTEKWYVHRGFLAVWKSIEPIIDNFVRVNYLKIYSVKISGYSHGGPLSVLCHEWFNFNWCFDTTTLAYGTPRIIYGKIPDSLKRRLYGCFVINNKFDIVSHLPFKFMRFVNYPYITTLRKNAKFKPFFEHTKTAYIEGIKEYLEAQYAGSYIYYG